MKTIFKKYEGIDGSISFVRLAGFFPLLPQLFDILLEFRYFEAPLEEGKWFLMFFDIPKSWSVIPDFKNSVQSCCGTFTQLDWYFSLFDRRSPGYERPRGGCTCLCRCPSGIWNLCTYNWDLDGQQSFKWTNKQKSWHNLTSSNKMERMNVPTDCDPWWLNESTALPHAAAALGANTRCSTSPHLISIPATYTHTHTNNSHPHS